MNKQLFTLLKLRYGKVTLIGAVIILALFLFSSITLVGSWNTEKEYFTSDEFKTEYQENPRNYTYWGEDGSRDIPYDSAQDYIDDQLMLFRKLDVYVPDVYEAGYNPDTNYAWNIYGSGSPVIPAVTFLFIGFLLFFIDLKTSFNTFLFSSGFSRKQTFFGKFFFVGIPLLAAYTLGNSIKLGWIAANIPNEYINSPMWVLVMSAINCLIFAIFFFAIGSFIGTLVGNLVFGPITLIVFAYMLGATPYALGQAYNTYLGFRPEQTIANGLSSINFELLFRNDFTKFAGNWVVWCFCLITTLILILLTFKGYQKISLENNGQYLLLPKWRVPIVLLMGAFSSLCSLALSNPLDSYLFQETMGYHPSLVEYVFRFLVQLVLVFAICWLVVYSSKIMQVINRRREKMGKLV